MLKTLNSFSIVLSKKYQCALEKFHLQVLVYVQYQKHLATSCHAFPPKHTSQTSSNTDVPFSDTIQPLI